MGTDVVIPIVFPDYLIAVDTPPTSMKIPDLLPGFDLFPSVVHIPPTKNKLPYLGHAGVLFFHGTTGTTKYYEYGRYDRAQKGLTRRMPISDVIIGPGGKPTRPSLVRTLDEISHKAGHGGRIMGAYIAVPGQYAAMLKYAMMRVFQNNNPQRVAYDLTDNSCMHFSKLVVESAGKQTMTLYDPRPVNFIEEMRKLYPSLDYTPPQKLTITGVEGL